MTPYRWLLLDADNTLFDFDAAEDFALTRTFIHYGLPTDRRVKDCYRSVNAPLWAACDRGEITTEALELERFNQFFALMGVTGNAGEWNRLYLEFLAQGATLLPGAEGLCRRLSQRYILALVTNGIPFVQRRRMAGSPIERYFQDRLFISGEMGCRKPQKQFFERVLAELGATRQKNQVLVIGDSLTSDILGAFNARLDSLWFNRTGKAPGAVKPTYTARSYSDMEDFLLPSLFPYKPSF